MKMKMKPTSKNSFIYIWHLWRLTYIYLIYTVQLSSQGLKAMHRGLVVRAGGAGGLNSQH